MKQYASHLLLIFSLLFISGQCTHFRGGTITWSVPESSRTVTFTVTTYWKVGSELIPSSVAVNLGDGNSKTYPVSIISTNSEFATVSGIITYTYANTGRFTVSIGECCRTSGLRVGAKTPLSVSSNTLASTLPWRLTTSVSVRGVYDQSPTIVVPPVVDFGVGPNTLTITSSVDSTFSFSSATESSLGYTGLPAAALFSTTNPRFISDPNTKTVGILSWDTSALDVGLWATQIKVSSPTGAVIADFLIRVNNVPTTSNFPRVLLPVRPYFPQVLGETVTFTVGCSSEAGGDFKLTTPILFPGMTINGAATSSITVKSNDVATVVFTPRISNGAKNQQFILTFTCQSTTSLLSNTSSVYVSVGVPLVLSPPPPAIIDCHPHCGCVEVGVATATDGCCGEPAVTYKDSVSLGSCNVKFNRTWTAINLCGQVATFDQQIWVNDVNAPVFDSVPADTTVQCYWYTGEENFETPFSHDTCSDSVISVNTVSSKKESHCNNTVTRTFTATDKCGNTAEAQQVITVIDTGKPYLTVATEIALTVECPAQKGFFDGIATAFDDCSTQVELSWEDSANITCGKFIRTFKAVDECGNTADKEFELEIKHTQPPTITLPTGYGIPKCKADIYHLPPATAKSYCGYEYAPTLEGPTFTEKDKCYTGALRVWSVTDECGIATTVEEPISIVDDIKPTIVAPKDFTIECVFDTTKPDPYRPDFTGGFAYGYDSCGENVTISFTDEFKAERCHSYITRTWVATDSCGNNSTAIQTILIVDTTPPVFNAPPPFNGKCDQDLPNSGAIDYSNVADCHPPQVTLNDSVVLLGGDKCHNRIIIRKWHAHDQCGNKADQEQVIRIEDPTPPTVTLPGDTTIECESSPSKPEDLGFADGKDECDEKVNISITFFDVINPDGSGRKRVWVVSDTCGNTRNETQQIFYNNTMPNISCPANVTVPCRASSLPNNTGFATASDKCTGTLKPTYTDTETGPCPTVISRVWSVYNPVTLQTSTCLQRITIDHPEGPALTPHKDLDVKCEVDALTFTTTGGACSTPICPEDNVTKPTYKDDYLGDKCMRGRQLKRTWTSKDQCQKTSTVTQTINIYDDVKPILEIPQDVTRTCRLNIEAGKASVTDNCDSNPRVTHSDSATPSETFCPTEVIRTWTATDCTGNTISKDQIIKIVESPPVFIGEPPKVLPPVQCPENFKYPTLQARDSCGNVYNATPTVTAIGTCPTTYKIIWRVTDACGRASTFEQTTFARDTVRPVIDETYIKDLSVECPSDIPVSGVVTVSDNCNGTISPEFEDIVPPSNCTCDACTGVVLRKWTAKDKCGNEAIPVIQKITTQKTKNPKIVSPPNAVLTCGQAYTPDATGTGLATAEDSCGEKLYVFFKDRIVTGPLGSFEIYRTWNTSDNCGGKDSVTQKITVDPRGGEIIITPPKDCHLVCGGDKTVESCGIASVRSTCPGDKLTVVPSMETSCPTTPGVWIRKWEAFRNGVATGVVAYQRVYAEDCKPIGQGIDNIPVAPIQLKNSYDVNAAITVTDLDLPCEVITLTWSWGDGTSDVQVCDPNAPTSRCVFANGALTATYPHTYISVGIKNIKVLVTDLRSVDIQEDVDDGPTWGRFHARLVLFPSNTGTVSGHIFMQVDREESIQKRTEQCDNSWVVSGPLTDKGEPSKCSCDGNAFIMFQSTFTIKSGILVATGDTFFQIDSCCGSVEFTSTNLTHLSIFDDGKTAVWTGFGEYRTLGLENLAFTAFAHTSNTQKAFYLRVVDSKGNALINTDPCYPVIADWRVNPFVASGLPNSKVVPAPDSDVDYTYFRVFNPSTMTQSALDDAQASQRAQSGMIAAIVVGMIVFVVIVGVILFVALKKTGGVRDNVFGQL